ncbi:MAG: ACP S-malonyltransferase [Isosphaeraceae bacterium]|nr:ACP S-malonyltransferase [Isosphaeraceae bacterium]
MRTPDVRSWTRSIRREGSADRGPRIEFDFLRSILDDSARSRDDHPFDPDRFGREIGGVAWAFRGYDVQNLGRSRELLEHARYAPIVRETLRLVGEIASDTVHRKIDLVDRVANERPTTLTEFADDAAMIVAMEWAQLRLLEEIHDVDIRSARLSIGYSIGELTALILGGTFTLEQLLPVPLALADDSAELAEKTSMGVVFSRGAALDRERIDRLCREISAEGRGLIGPSAHLSPNTTLILGADDTLARFESRLADALGTKVHFRRNPHRWPPLHSPLVWEKHIPNRAANLLYRTTGGASVPRPSIASCISGAVDYSPANCRDHLVAWTDHPQRLWDAIDAVLASNARTVVHVGPAPNLIPSTFDRLSNNVRRHLSNPVLRALGHDMAHTLSRHAWLSQLLPARASLLRLPWIRHVVLEDWLSAQPTTSSQISVPSLEVEGRVAR